MITSQQLHANRANARLSIGPKTRGGKWRAARNARRHGLSRSIWSDPNLTADAEVVALELAGPAASQELKGLARLAAAAHIDLDRIRQTRHQLIAQGLNDARLGPASGQAAQTHVTNLIHLSELLREGLDIPWDLQSLLIPLEEPEKFASAISNLARRLSVLERYERRSVSRRKKAFRHFAIEQRKVRLAANQKVTPGKVITCVKAT